METLITVSERVTEKVKERGSALLVSLMVLVGLSLLGLGFVAMSETETAIATNERNATQTLQVAEAGGLAVVEWFQNPAWAQAAGLMPQNDAAAVNFKVVRTLNANASSPNIDAGRYKSIGTKLLCDKPFKPEYDDRFYGTEDNPDILLNDTTAPVFMAEFNKRLFNTEFPGATAAAADCTGCDNKDGGRVTDIRLFAPPIDGGYTNTAVGWGTPATSGIPVGRGFTYGGTRFGLATIRVTATKYNEPNCGPNKAGCVAISQKQSKFVVSEWPFPGPQGPIQSNAQIATTGDFKVHWGKITATGDATLKRPYVGIPWQNAYDRTRFEYGYEWAGQTAAGQAGNMSQMWVTDPASGTYKTNHNWLLELLQRTFEDPWYQARSRQRILQVSVPGDPHATRYRDATLNPSAPICDPCNVNDAKSPGQSNMFQLQVKNEPDDYTDSLFPRIDYNFWKQIAQAADDQDNVYYLQWVTKDEFRDRQGTQKTFRAWADVMDGDGSLPGFYFFDTRNGLNPQNNGGGTLTPKIDLSGGKMLMRGFVYLNSSEFSPAGLGGYNGYYNMPGEIYRNIGYPKVEEDPGAGAGIYQYYKRTDPLVPCNPTTRVGCVVEGEGNLKWDWQDLAWSNGTGTKNKEFDYFVAQRLTTARSSSPTTLVNEWFVVQWFPGCTPGKNSFAGANCSEPHEPYLNFVYPNAATWNPLSPAGITVRSAAPGSITDRRRKKTVQVPPAALEACAAASTEAECTSNAYDEDGGLVPLNIMLDGVFYNEGTFTPTGNPHFFGSLLFEQSVTGAGTPDVWFDERLVKGKWPPGYFGFPRVYITTHETQ